MGRKGILAAAILIVLSAKTPSCAYTGNEYLSLNYNDRFNFTLGYLTGIGFFLGRIQRPAWFDDSVTNKQMADIIYNFVLQHPELRHIDMRTLGYAALQKSFPGILPDVPLLNDVPQKTKMGK